MKRLGLFAFFLIVLAMTGCDHTTKLLISDQLPVGHSKPIIAGVLDLRHTLNADTAFSLLGGIIPLPQRLLLLRSLAWVAVFVLISVIAGRWKAAGNWERLSWALILSGALGNAIDRLVRGPVIDFIDVHYWPVFNVADISVTVGLGLLLVVRRDWLFAAPQRG